MLRKSASAKRIIGGTVVTGSEFSDCVAVGDDERWGCTGTLIASNAVLTAGHCKVCSRKERFIPTRVFFGNNVNGKGKSFDIDEVRQHPDYDKKNDSNDMMVLVLKDKVPPAVADPRPLAPSKLIDEATEVRLVGFGHDDEWGRFGLGIKRQTEVPVASNSCEGKVEGEDDKEYYGCHRQLELVAGQPLLNRDTCTGDSGGPLYISDSKNWFLAGVTSRATSIRYRGCGDGGIYARVDRYRDWIESVLGERL